VIILYGFASLIVVIGNIHGSSVIGELKLLTTSVKISDPTMYVLLTTLKYVWESSIILRKHLIRIYALLLIILATTLLNKIVLYKIGARKTKFKYSPTNI